MCCGVGLLLTYSLQTSLATNRPNLGSAGTTEDQDEELQRAIGQLAELALLGAGRAAETFPETLEASG